MADPVSLNKARKARDRTQAKATAAENRVRFGQTRAERDRQAQLDAKSGRQLDGAKREP